MVDLFLPKIFGIFVAIKDPLATLTAAFFGTWFAFRLTTKKDREKIRLEWAAAGNRALFTVLRQFYALRDLREQNIDPVRKALTESGLGAFSMRPIAGLEYHDNIHIKLDEISFLLETNFRDLLAEASIMDARFHSAIQVVRDRSSFIESLQPLMMSAELDRVVSLKKVREVIGEARLMQLEVLTADVVKHVDLGERSLKDFHQRLFQGLSKQFPGHVFLPMPGRNEANEGHASRRGSPRNSSASGLMPAARGDDG